jgi:hypothetical protein
MSQEPDFYVAVPTPHGLHHFRLSGGPLSHPNTRPEALEAIGWAAAAWTRVETHVDAIIIHVNKVEHASSRPKLYAPRHPNGAQDKIKLMRKWFNDHPALAPKRQEVNKICEHLLDLAKRRNEFVHSLLEDFEHGQVAVALNSVQVKPDGTVNLKKQYVTLREFGAFAGQLNDLNQKLVEVSRFAFHPILKPLLQTL